MRAARLVASAAWSSARASAKRLRHEAREVEVPGQPRPIRRLCGQALRSAQPHPAQVRHAKMSPPPKHTAHGQGSRVRRRPTCPQVCQLRQRLSRINSRSALATDFDPLTDGESIFGSAQAREGSASCNVLDLEGNIWVWTQTRLTHQRSAASASARGPRGADFVQRWRSRSVRSHRQGAAPHPR